MEVTRTTFLERLPEIKEAVDSATFLAIDCETTGLHPGLKITAFDTQEQYFEKIHRSSKKFLVVQFGLCTFRYDADTMGFKSKAYNFFIFPHQLNQMMPTYHFHFQASSIDFLVEHAFDFNKLFSEGISYLNDRNEDKYQEALKKSRQARAKNFISPDNDETIAVTDEEKPFIDKILVQQIQHRITYGAKEVLSPCYIDVSCFVSANTRCGLHQPLPPGDFGDQTAAGVGTYKTTDVHVTRRQDLLCTVASEMLEGRASLETRQIDKDHVIVVTRPKSAEDRSKDEEAKVKEETKALKEAIGFSSLMQHISKSRKLIVGHKMMLNILHSVDKFLTPLPEDYKSFKECVHSLLPNIIDTEYMASTALFRDKISSTGFSGLVSALTSEPFSVPEIESEDGTKGYSIHDPKEHEAGYDAYMTGVCFLSMWKYLGKLNDEESPFENFDLLKPYLNRLFLKKIEDVPYIQLDGPDRVPLRDHVFYLSFPKEWKLKDILQLFNPFGKVWIDWIDDTSAYVALHKRDQANIVLTTLSQSNRYIIMTYAERQAVLNGKTVQETTKQATE